MSTLDHDLAAPTHGRFSPAAWGAALALLAAATASGAPPESDPLFDPQRAERLNTLITRLSTDLGEQDAQAAAESGSVRSTIISRKLLSLALARIELAILSLKRQAGSDPALAAEQLRLADAEIARIDEAALEDSDRRVMRDVVRLRNQATQVQIEVLQQALNRGAAPPSAGPGPGPGPGTTPSPGQYDMKWTYPYVPQGYVYVTQPAPSRGGLFSRCFRPRACR